MSKQTYIQILRQELEKRVQRNASYSAKAFANDAGLSPSYLSQVLSGKRSLKLSTAYQLTQRLNWSTRRSKIFLDLLQSNKSNAPTKDTETLTHSPYKALKKSTFERIPGLLAFSIMELTLVEDFQPTTPWIAERLGCSRIETERTIVHLVELGLLVWSDETLKCKYDFFECPENEESLAGKNFHGQVLEKAIKEQKRQNRDHIEYRTVTVSTSVKKISEAKKMIQDFEEQLISFLSTGKKDSVYQWGTQLFRLDKKFQADKLEVKNV